MSTRQFCREVVHYLSISVVLGLCIRADSSFADAKVVGYYASWNAANLPYDMVEYSNLTHIIVAFGTPNSDGSLSFDSGIPFPQLVIAAHSKGVKLLISLGGAGSGPSFSAATKDSTLRATLIANVMEFIQKNNYDGVDVDWETPSNATETAQLTSLVQGIRASFEMANSLLLITMAIPPGDYGGQHFDYQSLTNYVDWYDVMCYDFVGSWSAYSGHNSPLYQSNSDPNSAGSDSSAIVYNISRGIPPSKLVLGVPFYSVQFNASGLYQKLINDTTSNPYYQNVVSDLSAGWTYHWDDVSKVPYLTNDAQTKFITFEDTNSVKLKIEYADRQKLAGIMIWELSQDLYDSINGNGLAFSRQPLLEAINQTAKELKVVASERSIVSTYKLYDNFPNPFNPTTAIGYQLPVASYVTLKVYDALGRETMTLVDEFENPGKHEINFDGRQFSSGVYFYVLSTEDFFQTKKMLLLK